MYSKISPVPFKKTENKISSPKKFKPPISNFSIKTLKFKKISNFKIIPLPRGQPNQKNLTKTKKEES